MSFEDRLRDHLHASADGIDVPPEPFRAQKSRAWPPLSAIGVAIAVVALVGGFAFLVGRNTSPDGGPAAADTTVAELAEEPPVTTAVTPTDAVPQEPLPAPVAIGETFLDWERIGLPDGIEYLFEVVPVADGYLGVGNRVLGRGMLPESVLLESSDGRDWSAVTPAPPVTRGGFDTIATDGDRILLGGSEAVETDEVVLGLFGGFEADPVVYVHEQPGDWRRVELPTEELPEDFTIALPHSRVQAVALASDFAVAFGHTFYQPDFAEIAGEALGAELLEGDVVGWGFNGVSVQLTGPGGIQLVDVNLNDIGVGAEERALLGASRERMHVWRSTDLETFEMVEVEGLGPQFYIEHTGTLPDGRVWASGHGGSGNGVWASSDGITWEPALDGVTMASSITRYDDGWLVNSGYDDLDLQFREDGGEWQELTLGELLPESRVIWSVGSIEAGGLGIVAQLYGYDPMGDRYMGSPVAAEIEKDGYLITIREDSGNVTIDRGGERVATIHSIEGSDDARFDADARLVEFLDPDTGAVLVSVTFDELDEAQELLYQDLELDVDSTAVVFSPDGVEWSFQPLADIVGGDASLVSGGLHIMEVGPDFVLGSAWRWDGVPGPDNAPILDLWYGTLAG